MIPGDPERNLLGANLEGAVADKVANYGIASRRFFNRRRAREAADSKRTLSPDFCPYYAPPCFSGLPAAGFIKNLASV
jgi:hypothetical protein